MAHKINESRVVLLFILVFGFLFFSPMLVNAGEESADSQSAKQSPTLIQGLGGLMYFTSNGYSLKDNDGVKYIGDMPNMPFFGGIWQNSFLHGDVISLGGEAGILFGFINNTITFYSHNKFIINVKNKFFVTDLMMGLNIDIHPTDKFRIFGGAGPLVLYGNIKMDSDDKESDTYIIETNSSSAFSFGFYGRVGTDVLLNKTLRLGIQARYVNAELDFGNQHGTVDMEGMQYMLTFTEEF